MAIAIATVTFTVPFTNAVSAMEKSITTKNYNILENQKKNDELKYLIDELKGIEGVDTDALIKELQSIKFESSSPVATKGMELQKGGASAGVISASSWIAKNASKVASMLKKAGIDVSSKQVQFAAKAMAAYSDTVENAVYKFVRAIAHPSKTNAQCRTAAKLICLALPF